MTASERSSSTVTSEMLVARGLELGLSAVGVCRAEVLEPARTVLHLRKQAGLADTMQFTYRNPDRSTDPATPLPSTRSWIAAATTHPWSDPVTGESRRADKGDESVSEQVLGRVARYAWADHYGRLRDKLDELGDLLRAGGHRAVVVADSNKTVDRNVAWRAGIGWYGKNSNILVPGVGSWVVLGAIATDAELEPTAQPLSDGCGRCTACIDDCPTGAIVAPGMVDARTCLAWVVQAPGTIPTSLRVAVGDRLYGCDDCQTVCPPNRRSEAEPEWGPGAEATRVDVLDLLSSSDEELSRRHGRWYVADRNFDHVRRTALVVVGNTARPEPPSLADKVVSVLKHHLSHPEPLLRAHAVWACRRLGLDTMAEATRHDHDPTVRSEWDDPVTPRFDKARWAEIAEG